MNFMINGYWLWFVPWNIFLALIPCVIAFVLHHYFVKKSVYHTPLNYLVFGLSFIVWFFFFPNTAYLFSLVRHLVDYCEPESTIRICREAASIPPFFFFYAAIGIPTFIYALKRMSQTLGVLFDYSLETIFPIFMIPITSIGLVLGLVERFNSWEIVQDPLLILRTGFGYFNDPVVFRAVLAYSVVMYLIYFTFPYLFKLISDD